MVDLERRQGLSLGHEPMLHPIRVFLRGGRQQHAGRGERPERIGHRLERIVAADSSGDGDAALAEQFDREPCAILGVARFFALVIRQVVQVRNAYRDHEMDRDRAVEARVDLLPERWRTAMLIGDHKQPRLMVECDGPALHWTDLFWFLLVVAAAAGARGWYLYDCVDQAAAANPPKPPPTICAFICPPRWTLRLGDPPDASPASNGSWA